MTEPETNYEAAERIAIRQEGCNEKVDEVLRYPIEEKPNE